MFSSSVGAQSGEMKDTSRLPEMQTTSVVLQLVQAIPLYNVNKTLGELFFLFFETTVEIIFVNEKL